jgi:zinc D-Ala-D-Ala carboxypeptidase
MLDLTQHFSRGEFTRSQVASRRGIVNEPTEAQWAIIASLTISCLEPARDALGAITVSSGYRCPSLNKAIGGANKSDHQVLEESAAADLIYPDLGRLFRFLYMETPWSRLIWEFNTWIHVSWNTECPVGVRRPLIKTDARDYEALTYEEIVSLAE